MWLKGFFHGSAHIRVLKNFKSVYRPGTKPISEVLRGEVSKVDLSVLHIGEQKSFCLDHILFRRLILVLFYCFFT